MDKSPKITTDSEPGPVLDLDSIALPDSEDNEVIDFNAITIAKGRIRPSAIFQAILRRAPDFQLLVRLSLPILGIIYFLLVNQKPLIAPPPSLIRPQIFVIFCCCLIIIAHSWLHYRSLVHGIQYRYTLYAISLDIFIVQLLWLCDPIDPAPMMLLILIAIIGNGIQNGYQAFRTILMYTWIPSGLVLGLRCYAIYAKPSNTFLFGFNYLNLLFIFIITFLILYTYFLVYRIDTIKEKAEKRTTDLELNNYKLKQLGLAVQRSEARYRNLFESSSIAMVLIEENMRISLVNSKFEELTKYSKAELYNKRRLTDFIVKEDLQRIKRFHSKRRKLGGTSPTEYECQLLDKNQKIKHVIIQFNVMQWHERIFATLVDITSRKQAREAIQRSYRKLRQATLMLTDSQKRYRNLFENTGTATIVVEKNMRISMANSKFCELTGFYKREITGGKRLSEFIERKNLYRIRRFTARQKEKGLPPPTEYECLIVDKQRDLRYVVMKIYTPPSAQSSIVSFFDITKRKEAEAALQEAHERLRLAAVIDELTQVANRRQFNEQLNREWNRLKREGLPLGLIMCDVDCFKLYNDNYGHQKGDTCLSSIASTLKNTIKRSVDLVARYGGEEFVVVMPNTDIHGALHVAETLRKGVEDLKIPNTASIVVPYITLSLGVSCMIPSKDEPPEILVKDADNALYEAKHLGRNRVALGKLGRTDNLPQRILWETQNKPMVS